MIACSMEQYSAAHVAAIVAMAAAAAVLVKHARRNAAEPSLRLTRALALVIGSAYLVEHATYAARGVWTVSANLPFHLSDAVTFVAVAALWRPQTPLLVEALYFWAFSASLQAVVSPGIGASFPDVLYFTYFIIHAGAVVAGCLLVFGYRQVPRRGAVFRVLALTICFAMVAGLASVATGGNYMFLRAKPPRASLLDLMGPWPWYIVGGAVVALALFLALAALAAVLRSDVKRS